MPQCRLILTPDLSALSAFRLQCPIELLPASQPARSMARSSPSFIPHPVTMQRCNPFSQKAACCTNWPASSKKLLSSACNKFSELCNERAAAGLVDNSFRFVSQEVVYCFLNAGAGSESIVVKYHNPARIHSGIKKSNAVRGRLVQINVNMDKTEFLFCCGGEALWNPSGMNADCGFRLLKVFQGTAQVAFTPIMFIYLIRFGYSLKRIKDEMGPLLPAGLSGLTD